MPFGDGGQFNAGAALESSLRNRFGDESFPDGRFNAQAALNQSLRKEFGDDVFVNGRYSVQAALEILGRKEFGEDAFPVGNSGPTPPPAQPVAPPLDDPTTPVPNFDPGVFGPNFNQGGGFPGQFGDRFNRPPGLALNDPNDGPGFRIPGFGDPNPGPQRPTRPGSVSSAPLPGSTPQRNLFQNTPPAQFGSANRIGAGSNRLRGFLGAA